MDFQTKGNVLGVTSKAQQTFSNSVWFIHFLTPLFDNWIWKRALEMVQGFQNQKLGFANSTLTYA